MLIYIERIRKYCGKGLIVVCGVSALGYNFAESYAMSETTNNSSRVVESCPITVTSGMPLIGDEFLSALVGWPTGILEFPRGGYGYLLEDGSLRIKLAWNRGVTGDLKIGGRRLDGVASPLRSHIPDGYGLSGSISTYLIFPTPGCWEVIGKLRDHTVKFVVLVKVTGELPSSG